MNPEESPPPSLNLPFPQQKNVSRISRRSVKKPLPATILQCNAWPIEPSPESSNPGNQEIRFGYRDHIFSPTTPLANLRPRTTDPLSLNPPSPRSPSSSACRILGRFTPSFMLLSYHPIMKQKSTDRTTLNHRLTSSAEKKNTK